MYLKFEKNKIRFRISQPEATILLAKGLMADSVSLPDGSSFVYRIEVTGTEQNSAHLLDGILTLKMTRLAIEYLVNKPTKDGILFLQTAHVIYLK